MVPTGHHCPWQTQRHLLLTKSEDRRTMTMLNQYLIPPLPYSPAGEVPEGPPPAGFPTPSVFCPDGWSSRPYIDPWITPLEWTRLVVRIPKAAVVVRW